MAKYVLRTGRRTDARARLFCFPCAGSTGSEYLRWERYLTSSVEICAIQRWPNTNIKGAVRHSLLSLVEAVIAGSDTLLDRPMAVFGHSVGALMAFEFVRRLRSQGIHTHVLLVSGRFAPDMRRPGIPWYVLGDNELLEDLKRHEVLSEELSSDEEALQATVPLLRADLQLADLYEYGDEPPLRCPIVALAGEADRIASPSIMENWRRHTSTSFRLLTVPGGHFFVRRDPQRVLTIVHSALIDHIGASVCAVGSSREQSTPIAQGGADSE